MTPITKLHRVNSLFALLSSSSACEEYAHAVPQPSRFGRSASAPVISSALLKTAFFRDLSGETGLQHGCSAKGDQFFSGHFLDSVTFAHFGIEPG